MPRIRWSKLRAELKDRITPSLRSRIALHQARYRRTREEAGRVWLELDGRELISFDTSSYIAKRSNLTSEVLSGSRPYAADAEEAGTYQSADDIAGDALRRAGEYDDYSARVDLESYLSLSIEDALRSPSPLIRALAVVDRRVGKRRLQSLAPMTSEHPLVTELFRTRCEADGAGKQAQ
jgi:hypothetical protein